MDRARLLPWIPVFLWLALVLGLGSSGFNSEQTSRFLDPLLQWLLPEWHDFERRRIHLAIRKLAHVFEYAVTALLVFRAFWISWSDWTRLRIAAATLLFVLAAASADELRQSYLTTRTGTFSDVLLDGTGGVIGAGAAAWILRRRKEPSDG